MVLTLRLITFSFLFLMSISAFSQMKKPTPFYFVVDLQTGANAPGLLSRTSDNWMSLIGPSAALKVGLNYRKNRSVIGLNIGTQLHLLNYEYRSFDFQAEYSVGFWTPLGELSYWHVFDWDKNPYSDIAAGLAVGVINVDNDHISREGQIDAHAYSFSGTDYFLRPSIGLTKAAGKNNDNFVRLSVNYTFFPMKRDVVYVDLNRQGESSTSAFEGNFLSLGVEFDLNLKKKVKEKPPEEVLTIPDELLTRKEHNTKRVKLPKRKTTIVVWDNMNEDNDTISIVVNDQVVLKEHLLTHRKKRVRVHLDHGANSIKVVAHNEGTEGKNTCAIKFKSGTVRKKLIFDSSLEKTEGAVLTVE